MKPLKDADHPPRQLTLKTFIANITTQVIERHIVRGLETIISPVAVGYLSDAEIEAMIAEPATAKNQRHFLEDRVAKLKEGQEILRNVMMNTRV